MQAIRHTLPHVYLTAGNNFMLFFQFLNVNTLLDMIEHIASLTYISKIVTLDDISVTIDR